MNNMLNLKELKKNGFLAVENALSDEEFLALKNATNRLAYDLILEWSDVKFGYKTNEPYYLDIVNSYLFNNRPTYRRDPQSKLTGEDFLNFTKSNIFRKNFLEQENGNKFFSGIKNIRFKSAELPWSIAPWHLDRDYLEDNSSEIEFAIFWFPISDWDVFGGGVELIPYSEYKPKITDSGLAKDDDFFKRYKSIKPKLKPKDVLIMDDYLIHRTIPRTSSSPFWSADFRVEYGKAISKYTKNFGFNLL